MPSQNHYETPNAGFSLRAWRVGLVLASIMFAVVAVFMPALLLPTILGFGLLGLAYGAYRTAQYFGFFQQTPTAQTNTATTPPVETHEEEEHAYPESVCSNKII